MVSVDVQRFVDAPGGPGGGQGERDSVGADGKGNDLDTQIGMAGFDGKEIKGDWFFENLQSGTFKI